MSPWLLTAFHAEKGMWTEKLLLPLHFQRKVQKRPAGLRQIFRWNSYVILEHAQLLKGMDTALISVSLSTPTPGQYLPGKQQKFL